VVKKEKKEKSRPIREKKDSKEIVIKRKNKLSF